MLTSVFAVRRIVVLVWVGILFLMAPRWMTAQGAPARPDAASQVMLPATPPLPRQAPIPPLTYSGPLPMFAVASVKKVAADAPRASGGLGIRGGDRFVAEDHTLRGVITAVFNARDFQVVGGPRWMTTDRFVITGKSEGEQPRDQLYLMMRSLLGERFRLKTHVERRAMSVHVLERVAPDRPLGGEITPQDCSAGAPALTYQMFFDARRRGSAVPCGVDYMNFDGIVVAGVTMSRLAMILSSSLEGIVVDRTGLAGTYSVRLDFGGLDDSPLNSVGSAKPNAGSVFSAVLSQGLRLVQRSEPVEVLVIDSVEPPSEN